MPERAIATLALPLRGILALSMKRVPALLALMVPSSRNFKRPESRPTKCHGVTRREMSEV